MEMEKIIEKRNELAKQIFLRKGSTAIVSIVTANEFMKELYGEEWDKEQSCSHSPEDNGISVHTDKDGVKWVRVKIFEEDFLIAAREYKEKDKTEFNWEEAVEIGTFNKKQCHIIVAFINTINDKLKEIGGDTLASVFWSSAEYDSRYGWYVFLSDGLVNFGTKHFPLRVRPCKTFED